MDCYTFRVYLRRRMQVVISDVKSYEFNVSRTSWPRGQNFVLGLGLDLKVLSLVGALALCIVLGMSLKFCFGLVKMSVMMELIIIVSL